MREEWFWDRKCPSVTKSKLLHWGVASESSMHSDLFYYCCCGFHIDCNRGAVKKQHVTVAESICGVEGWSWNLSQYVSGFSPQVCTHLHCFPLTAPQSPGGGRPASEETWLSGLRSQSFRWSPSIPGWPHSCSLFHWADFNLASWQHEIFTKR